MAEFSIPCDTFARLANVLGVMGENCTPWFRSIRIDNGIAVATNRQFMAIEKIPGDNRGVAHIVCDAAMLAQCKAEAPAKSVLAITVIDGVNYATARTTLGWNYPGNALVTCSEPNEFDRWKAVALEARDAPHRPAGGMFWDAKQLAALAASSPSGSVVFPENIDTMRPTVIRDVTDYEWCGIFRPREPGTAYVPATVPTWLY